MASPLFIPPNVLPLSRGAPALQKTHALRLPHPNARARRAHGLPTASTPQNSPPPVDPSTDASYMEVQPFSITPVPQGCALLTLRPLTEPQTSHSSYSSHSEPSDKSDKSSTSDTPEIAFKMSVTASQMDALKRALRPRARRRRDAALDRPSSHDLLKSLVDAAGAVITQAAITHMRNEVFIASVWLRTPSGMHVIDARPSDALISVVRARAPMYLHVSLLRRFNVATDAIRQAAKRGQCELLAVGDDVRSTRSLVNELRRRPTVFRLAVLQMRLDVAVKCERFLEACRIREEISRVCPVDDLQRQLDVAIGEQRFLDAGRLQDQITLWRARLRMWEKGALEGLEGLDGLDKEGEREE